MSRQLLHGTEGDELVVEVHVVPLHDHQLGHGLAGDGLTLTLSPVLYGGLCQLVGGVVSQRCGDYVLDRFGQMGFGKLAYLPRQGLEDVPVGLSLPGRGHRRSEGMYVGVKVRGVEVVLLVPEGGGQHYVRVEGGGVHPEVDVDHKIHLAFRCGVPPDHLLDLTLGNLIRYGGGVGPEVVLEEELMPLGTRPYGVSSPYDPHPGPVLGSVGILYGEPELLLLEEIYHVLNNLLVRLCSVLFGFLHQLDGVFVELGIPGKPSQSDSFRLYVYGVPLIQLAVLRGRVVSGELVVVPPLAGVNVVPGGSVLLSGGLDPVQSEGYVRPGYHGSQLLLPHVVVVSSTLGSNAARKDKGNYLGSVEEVVVVPVVQTRSHDDHTPSFRLLRGDRPLPSELDTGIFGYP